ncbi:MAG: hypothetical protein ACOY3F_07985 [Bacillota bacterium]
MSVKTIPLFDLSRIADQAENRLTHFVFSVLSHLADEDPSILVDLWGQLGISPAPSFGDVEFDEQCRIGGNQFDVLITAKNEFLMVVESKLDSPLDPAQLERYARWAMAQPGYAGYAVVAITRWPSDADVAAALQRQCGLKVLHMTWADLYTLIEQKARTMRRGSVLFEHLKSFMRRQGVAPVALNLHPGSSVQRAVQVIRDTRQFCETMMSSVKGHVRKGTYVRSEDKLIDECWYRGLFKCTPNRKSYQYDAHILLDFSEPELEIAYLFYVSVRDWDRQRASGKADTDYLREGVDYAAALGPPARPYRLALYDWARDPVYWDGVVADAPQLKSPTVWPNVVTNWQANNRSEMIIEHRLRMDQLLSELDLRSAAETKGEAADLPSGVEQQPAHIPSAQVAALAQRFAEEFDRFIDSLRPYDSIDYD